jgi:hypothetical protein
MILYAIINVFVLLSIARKYGISSKGRIRAMIAASSASILLICNLPSFRNYFNYGVFKPTDILESNLFNYLGKNVMTDRNNIDAYEDMRKGIEEAKELGEVLKLRREYALQIYKKYPGTTLRYYICNAVPVMGHTHLLHIAHFWGYHWEDESSPEGPTLKGSNLIFAMLLFWYVIYLAIYILLLSFLIRLLKAGNWLFLFTIIIYIAYFMLPSYLAVGGNRHRLTIEWLIAIVAFSEIRHYLGSLMRRTTTVATAEN